MKKDAQTIIDSPEFRSLVASKGAISAILTIVMLGAYFGFILVLAFNKALLSAMLSEGLSVGIPVGLFVILLAWGLTGVYVFWANDKYDGAVSQIRQGLKRSE
ncbi:MAG: DUF485 domain-containing protein [Desulfovibrio sp.]|nr:DUF485 domain-containing protein [Desulfovibrio sp.]